MAVLSAGYSFDDDYRTSGYNRTKHENDSDTHSISTEAIVLVSLASFLVLVFGGYFCRRLSRKIRERSIEKLAVQEYKYIREEEEGKQIKYRSPEDKLLLDEEDERTKEPSQLQTIKSLNSSDELIQ